MSLSQFVKKIKSADKDKKYGCVIKLKASVSMWLDMLLIYTATQIHSYIQNVQC